MNWLMMTPFDPYPSDNLLFEPALFWFMLLNMPSLKVEMLDGFLLLEFLFVDTLALQTLTLF